MEIPIDDDEGEASELRKLLGIYLLCGWLVECPLKCMPCQLLAGWLAASEQELGSDDRGSGNILIGTCTEMRSKTARWTK